jgi:hypothetical protein
MEDNPVLLLVLFLDHYILRKDQVICTLDYLRLETFCSLVEWNVKDDESKRNNVLDAIRPRVGAKIALYLG